MIRILLAEDQTLVRDGLKALLEMQLNCSVTAVANGEEAVAAARAARPDIAVVDVRMPVMDGIASTRALKELYPDLPVLALTTFDDHTLVHECLDAGAGAYLLKDIHPEDLANAIRLLVAGETLIPGDLARELLEGERSAPGGQAKAPPPTRLGSPEPLTARQLEVLELIAEGLSNREIAGRLYLSEGRVKNIVSEIYARLDVRDRVQAALKMMEIRPLGRDRGEAGPGSPEHG